MLKYVIRTTFSLGTNPVKGATVTNLLNSKINYLYGKDQL